MLQCIAYIRHAALIICRLLCNEFCGSDVVVKHSQENDYLQQYFNSDSVDNG